VDLAVRRSKRLERLLKQGCGAHGRGLHAQVTSVEAKLPVGLVKRLRFIATLRNKIIHDLDYRRFDDRAGFIEACDLAERDLEQIAGPGIRDSWRLTMWVVASLAGLIVVGMGIAIWMLRSRGIGLELRLW
jgi:hypothetical protein